MASPRLKYLNRSVDTAGRVYNHCIALHRRYYRRFKVHLQEGRLKAHLAKLRRTRCPAWKDLNSQTVQAIVERIEFGYKLFIKALREKSPRRVRPPTFRKLKRFRSITLKQCGWKVVGSGKLLIGKRVYRFYQSRMMEGIVKTVTISRNLLGEFFVSFSCDGVPSPDKVEAATGEAAGFDFGLKTFLMRSDGDKRVAPCPLKAALAELRSASRAFSRKVKGSGNWRRAKFDLARLHGRLAHVRGDWQWKLARELVLEHPVLVFEDLSLSGMSKLWGRKMADLGFADFLHKVEWLCTKLGREFIKIPRYERTTGKCWECGNRQDLTLKDRVFVCEVCEHTMDRDWNAALNILLKGLEMIGWNFESGHRLSSEVAVRPIEAATAKKSGFLISL